MPKEFVMRGQTASYNPSTGEGGVEVLNFSGYKPGYAYRLIEFQLYPSTNIIGAHYEMVGSITAGKTGILPITPDFNDEALIATAVVENHEGYAYPISYNSVVNDTFLITQNLILMVQNADSGTPVNWQCKFEAVKMGKAEEAVTNYKQYLISDV